MLAIIPLKMPLPRIDSIQLDGRVFAFAFAISVLTAMIFGLVPALHMSRLELQDALKQGSLRSGTGGNRLTRHAFVVAEVGVALLLLIGAGLMVRSFARLISVNPGFEPEHVLTMRIFTSPSRYDTFGKRGEYIEKIRKEIRAVPGVRAAGSIHALPLTGNVSGSCYARADQPAPSPASSPSAEFLVISPGYFETMGTSMVGGRDLGEQDRFGSRTVMIVNQTLARRVFAGEDPIGKRVNLCWGMLPNPAEIVGVVADARQTELNMAPQPTIFLANAQSSRYFATFVVRAKDDPRQVTRSVVAAIHRVDPEQAVSDIQTMDQVFSDSVARPRFQLVLLLVFAGIAVLLAGVGVYGVVSYSVAQRTQEIGVRMALGARHNDVARLMLREGLVLASIGVAVGLVGALALTRVLRSLLFEVTPTDPVTLVSVSCLLLLITVVAMIVPARRAAKVDPMVALRYE